MTQKPAETCVCRVPQPVARYAFARAMRKAWCSVGVALVARVLLVCALPVYDLTYKVGMELRLPHIEIRV